MEDRKKNAHSENIVTHCALAIDNSEVACEISHLERIKKCVFDAEKGSDEIMVACQSAPIKII